MYFENQGKGNTGETLKLSYEKAKKLGITEIIVATTTGDTAYKALKLFNGFKLTAVTYHCGFREPFKKVLPDNVRKDLESQGVTVVSATHALSGVERSLSKKYTGMYPVLLIADTLRLFGHGVKVAVEIAIMASDAGALSGSDIIAIGGTAKGADASLVIKPAGQSELFNMKIREIICKPREF